MSDILLVEDQVNPRKAFAFLLKKKGYDVDEAENGSIALDKLNSQFYDLVITDLKMSSVDGMEVLKQTKELHPNTEVILMTAYGTIDSGVKAMKMGAYDYITKPFNNDEFLILVRRALEKRQTMEEVRYLKEELYGKYKFENIIGNSAPMQEILKLVTKIAVSDSTVLICGESGTGKELIARAIHANSSRKDKPMITVNCGSLPENLLESELFGHVRGSFTGAIKDKKGLFQEAHTGTIFLDEIGEITAQTQVRLLRCIQEREIRRLGDNRSFKVDVRIIAATNRDLEKLVQKGTFREDLFYRVNVIPIHLPPLRERKEDIPVLVNHFLEKYMKKLNRDLPKISESAMQLLLNYHWPGNVRELENLIERVVTLNAKSVIEPDDFYFNFSRLDNSVMSMTKKIEGMTLEEMEKWLILDTLENCSGNQKLASKKLGISTTTLWRKLGKYEIDANRIKTF